VLRARAAEQLIQATDPAAASRLLFELIATELKLNVFLLHALDEVGALKLIAHAGLSEAMAAEVESQGPPRFRGGRAGPIQIATVQARDDKGTAVLRSIGLKSYFSIPLKAGEELIGFLGFGRRWTDCFDDEDQAFLIDVGGYLSLALERVRWESRLREGEERLRLGMEVGGFGTYDVNLGTGRVFLSPEALAIRGFSPDRPPGINDLDRDVHPDDRERVLREWEASLQPDGPGTWDYEYRLMMPDGAERWIHSRGRTFFSGEGKARRAVRKLGLVRDITEVKLADERLRTSEERLRLALEAAGLGVFEHDDLRDKVILSPRLRAIYGLDADEPVDFDKIVELRHPDDRVRVMARVEQVRNTGEIDDFFDEFRIYRPDGEMRWLAMMGSLFSAADRGERSLRIIAVLQDITERKLAEERLRQSEERLRTSEQRLQRAQELGGVASFEWNHATDETWVSESYREIFGLDPSTRLGAALFQVQLHPDDRERVIARLTQIPDDVDTIEIVYRITRPNDGQERWIYSTMGVLRDPATGTIRLAGIALDITERKRDEERERLLSREVDHRAKNLLSVVQAMVQLTHAPSIPAFVDQVKGRIHALGRAHSLLAASRWSGAELAQLIAEEFAPFADDAGRVRLAGPAIALRPAAAQSMALMIHELTTNAAKYGALSSPTGQVEVRWEIAAPPGELRLCWRERGGPPVAPPTRFGFGLTHIRGSVERQLGGTLDLQWLPHGLQCRLSLPARQLAESASHADAGQKNGGRRKD